MRRIGEGDDELFSSAIGGYFEYWFEKSGSSFVILAMGVECKVVVVVLLCIGQGLLVLVAKQGNWRKSMLVFEIKYPHNGKRSPKSR